MPKEKLEHHKITGLKPPDDPVEYYDTIESGLTLRLSKAGTKSFCYRYRFKGKNRRFTIGKFPNISLAEARKRVQVLKVNINDGIDPQAEKEKAREPDKDYTFPELCERFSTRKLPALRKRTRDEYQRIIDKELTPKLAKYLVKDISRKQIVDLLDAIAIDRGKAVLSNRVRAVLSSIFSFGIDKTIVEVNPVQAVKRKKKKANGENVEKRRKRIYTHDEIKELWDSFEQQEEPIQSLYKTLLICAQRSGETRRMKWQDVDFKKQLWTIPGEQTKANRTHEVPLPETVLKMLENLQYSTVESEYVFQSPKIPNQPIEWLQKASKRIRSDSGVEDFRIHDLRRTAASYMAKLGVQRTTLGKILNHKGLAGDDQVTAIYDQHDYLDEKRKALQKWSFHLEQIIKGKETKIHKIG